MRLAFGMAHAHPPLSHVCAILRVWGQDYDMPCSLPGKLFLNTACRTPKDSVGLFSTGHWEWSTYILSAGFGCPGQEWHSRGACAQQAPRTSGHSDGNNLYPVQHPSRLHGPVQRPFSETPASWRKWSTMTEREAKEEGACGTDGGSATAGGWDHSQQIVL